ncbi:MAG: biotin--[acetyl-CoA-carboxylase] ligase, partial [Erysipelatoclostridium ramosum]|nr:biotin--[acetyl-CoA-carboxylase] ligase [Thomasclavelia ramosa]
MSYIELDEVDSTNDYVKRNLNKLPNLSVVRCN